MTNDKKKILIVDDEKDIIRLIESVLRQNTNYELISAKDGFFAGVQVGIFKPDIVILDIKMPGIDGFEVCKRIKSTPSTQHIKIMCVTGYGENMNIKKMIKLGADAYMVKPFDITELARKVENLLNESEKKKGQRKP